MPSRTQDGRRRRKAKAGYCVVQHVSFYVPRPWYFALLTKPVDGWYWTCIDTPKTVQGGRAAMFQVPDTHDVMLVAASDRPIDDPIVLATR